MLQCQLHVNPEENFPGDSEDRRAACRKSNAFSRNNSAPMLTNGRAQRCHSEEILLAAPELKTQATDPAPTSNPAGLASVQDTQDSASCSVISKDDHSVPHGHQPTATASAIINHSGACAIRSPS